MFVQKEKQYVSFKGEMTMKVQKYGNYQGQLKIIFVRTTGPEKFQCTWYIFLALCSNEFVKLITLIMMQ
jgi:hypothetical protein